ncbi:MAG: TetR/AcrR family transcriptional regulator [Acidimicrobiales bacterium]
MTRAITDACLRQLAEVGYANMSMERVAAEAGVARATVYRRFRDKADLATAAIAANGGDLTGRPITDPRGDLVGLLEEFDQRFAESCLEVLGALLGSREEPHALELHRQRVVGPRMSFFRAVLERARQLGALDADADLALATDMLVGAVFARRVRGGATDDRDWAARAVDAVWAGFGARRAGRSA